jgi:hypothetical protein
MRLDNEASIMLKDYLDMEDVDIQLVSPHIITGAMRLNRLFARSKTTSLQAYVR